MRQYKYTVRKLLFVFLLGLLVASPVLIREYKSANTTDRFILMAREIESFEKGGVDVLGIEDNDSVGGGVIVIAYIESYPDWTLRQDIPNFLRSVLVATARYDYSEALVFIGWDFPASDFRIQGVWYCDEMRRSSCDFENVPSLTMGPEHIKWPGIGNP